MTADEARALLGVDGRAESSAIAAAFRDAAKRAHPDVAGGDAEHFQRVLAAYRLLQRQPGRRLDFPPAPSQPRPRRLEITPLVAVQGGLADVVLDGRTMRATLPAGLRDGDRVRIDGHVLPVTIAGGFAALVRGHDLWLTVETPASVLVEGGRASLDTPLGRRTIWVSSQAAERRLVRLAGQGLPARGGHPAGDLFLRLAPVAVAAPESPARKLLRRFAAAWAA